jgi:hypothetical protein
LCGHRILDASASRGDEYNHRRRLRVRHGWPLLLAQAIAPTAGRSRIGGVLGVWIGSTTVSVSVIYWVYALLSYDPSVSRVDLLDRLVPYEPRTGIAVGLFGLCMLLSYGLWGVVAALVRPKVTIVGAGITGLFRCRDVVCLLVTIGPRLTAAGRIETQGSRGLPCRCRTLGTCQKWELEIGSSMAGSETSSGHPGVLHLPKLRNPHGNPLSDCAKCRSQFDAETLEHHYRERRSLD